MVTAYQIDQRDNVATLLESCALGNEVQLLGVAEGAIVAGEEIRSEHKIALSDIPVGESVIKYGTAIGKATALIRAGQTVHLHNCASIYDERSNSLDGETGAPTDTPYV